MNKIIAYIKLGKPRIASLLIFSGISTFVYASSELSLPRLVYFSILGILIVFSANSLNSYIDYKYDMLMPRTRQRPIPLGIISRSEALIFGITLMIISSIGFLTIFGVATTLAALFGALYYVLIYTILLKNRTVYNSVIGSVAGFMPSVTGWLAANNLIDTQIILISLLIFFWSPAHFWSLAYAVKDEYKRSGFLMLPAVKPENETKLHIVSFYLTTLLIYIGLILTLNGIVAKIGTIISTTLLILCIYTISRELSKETSWRSFKLSTTSLFIFYIFLFISGIMKI